MFNRQLYLLSFNVLQDRLLLLYMYRFTNFSLCFSCYVFICSSSSGAVRVLLQSGPGIHRCLFWLRQLQVGTFCGWMSSHTCYTHKLIPEHTNVLLQGVAYWPIWSVVLKDLIRGLKTARRKREQVSARRSGQPRWTRRKTQMPSWIFCNDVNNSPSLLFTLHLHVLKCKYPYCDALYYFDFRHSLKFGCILKWHL